MKMTKVSELSAIVGISKQAVYKKVSQPKYKKHVRVVNGIKHITKAGIRMLCEECGVKVESENKSSLLKNTDNENVKIFEMLLLQHKEEVDRLTDIVKNRDVEITDLRRMLENQQILTLNAQAEVKRLSTPPEAEKQQDAPMGLWQRWFGSGRKNL